MYQTILFDLDGTLTDSGQGILNSVAYALEKMGIKECLKINSILESSLCLKN